MYIVGLSKKGNILNLDSSGGFASRLSTLEPRAADFKGGKFGVFLFSF